MAAQGNSWPWGRLASTPQLLSELHLPGGFLYPLVQACAESSGTPGFLVAQLLA